VKRVGDLLLRVGHWAFMLALTAVVWLIVRAVKAERQRSNKVLRSRIA
jgi:hypothetical protein